MSDSMPPSTIGGATEGTSVTATLPNDVPAKQVRSWALWDWATQPFNSVLLTFVFVPLYLVNDGFVGAGQTADDLSSQWGAWNAIAGLLVLYLAPVLGVRAETSGGRKRWLVSATAGLALVQFALFFVQEDPRYFVAGAILMALGQVVSEVAGVNYNAMLHQVSTPATVGRVSGFGWGMGYLGGIVALAIVAGLTFADWFGLDTGNGFAYRLIALGCAVWTVVFAVPLVRNVPEYRRLAESRQGFFATYRKLVADMIALYGQSRSTFWFLFASAVYRDGLAGIFIFGGVLAAQVYGFGDTDLIVFAIAANVVAGVSTIVSGRIDDRVGARKVIIFALVVLIAMAVLVFALQPLGVGVFWVGGIILSAFVGPAQASSRALLSKVTPSSMHGEVFGLYATTGRIASPLSATAWTAFATWFGATRYGVLGIGVVLLVGLGLLLLVKIDHGRKTDEPLRELTGWNQNAITAVTFALFLGIGALVLLLTKDAHGIPGLGYVTAAMLLVAAVAVVPGRRALAEIRTSGEQGATAARAAVGLGYLAAAGAAASVVLSSL